MWKFLDDAAHLLISRGARAYAAPSIADARRICLDLRARGFASSVCYWNGDSDTPGQITHSNLRLLELLGHLDSHAYLSLKLPALRFDAASVDTILHAAAPASRLIHFDSHSPADADSTFHTIERSLQQYPHLGCTIPGRWLRSAEDAEAAVRLGLRVRVVKGQWADPQQPGMDMRGGFLRVIEVLRGRAACVAVASHDVPLARQALRLLMAAGTSCELELLYGLPHRAAVHMAQQLGVPIRFYVPQGKAWLPYVLKHARQNPRVLGWFARDLIRGFAVKSGRFAGESL